MLILRVLRRAQTTPLRCNNINLRGAVSHNLSPKQTLPLTGLRFQTTTPKTSPPANSKPPTPKFAFPERLCVYHAGTPRITFLACLKISTLFIFVFFGFVVTPAYIDKEGYSLNVLRTTLSAVVPLLFVSYTTAPFVSFIHMRIPPFARQSEELLRRFLRAVPPQTELEITTMSFIAKPRVSRVALADLRPASRRFGIANLARDTAADNARRRWYMFRAVGAFNTQLESNTVKRIPWVWESVMAAIKKQQG